MGCCCDVPTQRDYYLGSGSGYMNRNDERSGGGFFGTY